MARTVALLDVDDTLYFNYHPLPLDEKRINLDLLKSLKERGITDLYLFTDMVMEEKAIAHRQALIRFLITQGFVVHGVITSNDLLWSNCFRYKDAAIRHQYPLVYVRNSFKVNQPGVAFRNAVNELTNWHYLSSDTKRKSLWIARALIPYFLKKMDQTNPKGFMLELFLHAMPGWVDGIVIIDDRTSVLESVRAYIKKAHSLRFALPKIDIIHVSQQNRGCYYQQQLVAQMGMLNQQDFSGYIALHTIEREIQRLNASLFSLSDTVKQTIKQLGELKALLQQELSESPQSHKNSCVLFQTLMHANNIDKNFISYLCDFYAANIDERGSVPLLQRRDVQLVLKEVSRLRHDTSQYFFEGKKEKANLIENALLNALRQGAEDVTLDHEVRAALQHHRLFSFFGYKRAAALVNVEQARLRPIQALV